MIEIRQEQVADYARVASLIERAFIDMPHSDHKEHRLVERLRKSDAFIPELSLVALSDDGQVVGYILLTKITIDGKHTSLALAPVAVLPGYQGRGIGSMLINEGHNRARIMGYNSAVVIGHEDYYPRFGYKMLSEFGISVPYDVPEENCMGIELVPEALKGINGKVDYANEFSE